VMGHFRDSFAELLDAALHNSEQNTARAAS
jgi:hypothetical protein